MNEISEGLVCQTAPTVRQALDDWRSRVPSRQVTSNPDDTSLPGLYGHDLWQPVFRRMRETGPVNKVVGTAYGDYWNVCSYEALQEAEQQPEKFSSSWEYGGITIADPMPGEDFHLPMFIAMDEPEHGRQRRTVAPAFTPAEIERLSRVVRERTAEVLDRLPLHERFDWVEKVSVELATQMLAILLNFPWNDRHLLTFWSDWAGDMEAARIPELFQQRARILGDMAAYFHNLWENRRSGAPTADLLSMMIHSDTMAAMSEFEFMGNLALLIVGGNDTTRNSMSAVAYALDCFPDERARLQADPALIPNAVQEIIRWHTPISHMRRTATVDCELGGAKIAKGDKLALWYISANRDEAVFPRADQLDISRENARRHLSFGHGIHRCVGARLAELQIRTLLEEMAKRRLQANVVGEVERVHANFIHGFHTIEVELSRY
jgi:cytochrome P450